MHKFFLILVFAANLFFYITPFGFSVYYLINGIALVKISIAIFGSVISIIGRLISVKAGHILRENSHGLVSDSLFTYSRNPISLGMHITIFGLIIIFYNWYLWFGLIFYLINIHFKIRVEENHLQKKYGALYTSYQTKTPRYIIRIKW